MPPVKAIRRAALPLVHLVILTLVLHSRPINSARLVWIGRVTPTSFRLHIDLLPGTPSVDISKSEQGTSPVSIKNPGDPAALPGDASVYTTLRRFDFTDLQPRTKYYIFVQDPSQTRQRVASVTTFPEEDDNSDVTIALGSCQFRASWDKAYSDIRQHFNNVEKQNNSNPFFFLHMGDIAYPDITENDPRRYEASFREVLERDRVQEVFSVMPVPYMYDDHDYGANNAGFSSPSRQAALSNYRTMVPTYDLPSPDASYHAFTVGSVRVIMMDLRANAGRIEGSTLGPEQREWLFEEFEQADQYEVVVWMSSKPFIGKSEPGKDSWAGYPEERRLVADKIAELGVTNMVAVAGDAHMLAVDNGANSDYSNPDDDRPGGFPVFQAAPLGNVGTSKGGPYSEGCKGYRFFPNFQYGILKITKVGESDGPCVEFSGYKSGDTEEPLLNFRRCGTLGGVDGVGGQESSCSMGFFPAWVWVLLVLGIIFVVAIFGISIGWCVFCRRKKKKKKTQSDEETPEQVYAGASGDSELRRELGGIQKRSSQ